MAIDVGVVEQHIGDMICHDAVDLLGHAPVERAESRFHVCNRHVELHRSKCCGKGRCRVAVHDDDVGGLEEDGVLDANEHLSSHLGVAAAVDIEVDSRWIEAELSEEQIRHVRVEVLPCVHDRLVDPHTLERVGHDSSLDELRAGANNGETVHGDLAGELGLHTRLSASDSGLDAATVVGGIGQ